MMNVDPSRDDDAQRCLRCIPSKGYYYEEEKKLLPWAWKPLFAHPRWRIAPWVVVERGRMPVLFFCEYCDTVWHLRYNRSLETYEPEALPAGIDAVLRANGTLEEVWALVVLGEPTTGDFIAAYFSEADFDDGPAARRLVQRLEVPALHPAEAVMLVNFLQRLVHARRLKGIREPLEIPVLAPVATLLDRKDIWGDFWDTAEEMSTVRRYLDSIVEDVWMARAGLPGDRLRTRPQDRAELLAMAGPRNRLINAVARLERGLTDRLPGMALEAVGDFRQVVSRITAPPTPHVVEALVAALGRVQELTKGVDSQASERWYRLHEEVMSLFRELRRVHLVPETCADLVHDAVGPENSRI